MAILTKAPRGTQDVLPEQSAKWQHVEKTAMKVAELFGFKEIRFPTFEHTELFARGVGDSTDVVQKEMYTFLDKGERSITLRPEGTAGCMRTLIEHGLLNGALPVKASYLTSCFRYEKPQAGRLREFHQFGAELVGTASPAADAEMIAMVSQIFDQLQIEGIELEINSIGCPECRAKYNEALKEYFHSHEEELCETCRDRLERNPMRILDCKSPICHKIGEDAPVILDYLCDDCQAHFDELKERLDALDIEYKVNPTIVRGLDYYTRTVFEFVSTNIGSQGTVCGGGRYDGLVEEIGGPSTPGVGYGLGKERLLLTMEACGVEIPEPDKTEVFIAVMGEEAKLVGLKLMGELRRAGVAVQMDIMGRNVKNQFKYANRIGAKKTVVIGADELANNSFAIKDMATSEQINVPMEDIVAELTK